ncbi:uncharacterized protein [Primulina huaijiensis]|uniref:uncharacterized protein n=1 Tax=Primulina huaijiensis TaxID=1492673 RepID=UPI003CC76E0B
MAMLHCYADMIKCKVFLTTLIDSAQIWFEILDSQSTHFFEDFQKVFLHHFTSGKKYKKTAFSLFEVKQSPEESLRAYIQRFNRVALDVPSCASETKTTAFTQELREGEFFRSLTKKTSGDFDDLLARAEKYINMEEAQKQKREAVKRERGGQASRPEERGQRRSNPGHFSHHVPLKIARDRDVQECSRDLPSSQQFTRPEKKGFCTLHKVCYHNTEDYKMLKRDYVPPAVQGHNQQSKKPRLPPWAARQSGPSAREDSRSDPRGRRNSEPERKKSSPPVLGVIKIISGGSTNGDSNRARKSRSRRDCMEVVGVRRMEAVISFGPEDLKGVNLPHNDAHVIQAKVANYDIMRVFVDSGSSVNAIFKEALIQMDLQGYRLEIVETSLFSFAGYAVYPEGDIVLPLTFGTRELKKTVLTTFTVVGRP